MAERCLTTITEQWIRDRLQLKHFYLGDVRSLSLPGTFDVKIGYLGKALKNFDRLKSLDLSHNALVSVEGVQHLKMLERLILYNNRIPSVEQLKLLCELPVLRELDLRLNPLAKSYPPYRPHLVNAMPHLQKLDGCPIRDTERKAAILQFSPELQPKLKSDSVSQNCSRGSDQRLALIERLTKRFSFLNDADDALLNFVNKKYRDQSEAQSESQFIQAQEEAQEHVTEKDGSYPKQLSGKPILRHSSKPEPRVSSARRLLAKENSLKDANRPKVSFESCAEKSRCEPGYQQSNALSKNARHPARGYFTPNPSQDQHLNSINVRPPSPLQPGLNLSDPSNPVLHPSRHTYHSPDKTAGVAAQQAEQTNRGAYRKPLEMLLNLMDKRWTSEQSLHQNNSFMSQAVHILSMMESDICSREEEVRCLKREADEMKAQAAARESQHTMEVSKISAQLEEARRDVGKINEQLKIILAENVTLQKQLIQLERQQFKTILNVSPLSQIKEAQTEVEGLRKEIEELRRKVHGAESTKEQTEIPDGPK